VAWRSRDHLLAEQLSHELAQFDQELLLDLVYEDFCIRDEFGDGPSEGEYVERFPLLRESLAQLFEVHRVLGELVDDAELRYGTAGKHAVLMPSQTLSCLDNRFHLQRRLGSGTFGLVWLAWDSLLEREVAIKLPRVALHGTSVLREARMAAKLSHPGIVAVYEVQTKADQCYIVSEYLSGGTLRDLLRSGPLRVRDAVQLCIEVGDALQAAHDAGIVHRDLKPENILFDHAGVPHIADFGLSCLAQHDGAVVTVGTPGYMAPEQAGASPAADHRADVYSLGIVLHEMLTAIRPHRIKVEERPPIRLHPDLIAICRKASAPTLSARYCTAGELVDDLRRFEDGAPISARPMKLTERLRRSVHRKIRGEWKRLVIGIASSVVAFAAGCWLLLPEDLAAPRAVAISTNPQASRVEFIPRSRGDGSFAVQKTIYASGRNPTSVRLAPGDYLVRAHMEKGKVHEVFRHVPRLREWWAAPYRHTRSSFEDGTVRLPAIDVVPVENDSVIRLPRSHLAVDLFPVRGEQVHRIRGIFPRCDDAGYALLNFDDAVAYAEAVGKRLPTEQEAAECRSVVMPETGTYEWTASWSEDFTSSGRGSLSDQPLLKQVIASADGKRRTTQRYNTQPFVRLRLVRRM